MASSAYFNVHRKKKDSEVLSVHILKAFLKLLVNCSIYTTKCTKLINFYIL